MQRFAWNALLYADFVYCIYKHILGVTNVPHTVGELCFKTLMFRVNLICLNTQNTRSGVGFPRDHLSLIRRKSRLP
jgi:hypothetical protein